MLIYKRLNKNERTINNRGNSHVMAIGSLRVRKRPQFIFTQKGVKQIIHADIQKNFKSRGERPYIKQRWRDNPEGAPAYAQKYLI